MDKIVGCESLQAYLEAKIPISRSLGTRVQAVTPDSVTIWAPLGPNLNHHGTAFGGSASAVAIMAGWCLIFTKLQWLAQSPSIVIQRNEISYIRPIMEDFIAQACLADKTRWTYFLDSLHRHHKARAFVDVALIASGSVAGRFLGSYGASDNTTWINSDIRL
jgi:thioesterase domain-containing protein